jgi:glycosyltransferase involved in cell wall biosynthesis
VVPTRDRPDLLGECLAALRAELQPGDEVVVADSASADGPAVAAVAEGFGATYVRCDEPGASLARNAGWRAASAEQVAFVDDDVLVHPGWAEAMRDVVLADGVGFAVGRTVAGSGTQGAAPSTVTGTRPPEVIATMTRRPVGGSGNCVMRRSALDQVGGFDERMGPGRWLGAGEDLELFDRLLHAGWTGRYRHDAVAAHEQWRDEAERRRLQLGYGKGMGARVAAAVRRDRATGGQLLVEVFRLGRLGRIAGVPAPPPAAEEIVTEESPGPVLRLLWRWGAVMGLVVGLVVLRPRGPRVAAR